MSSIGEHRVRIEGAAGDLAAVDADGRVPVVAHNPIGDAISAGEIYTSGGPLSLSSGQTGHVLFENPAASGRFMMILGFGVRCGVTTSLQVRFRRGATSSQDLRDHVNHSVGIGSDGDALVRVGTGTPSGGDLLAPSASTVRDDGFTYDRLPFLVPPGVTLSMDVTAPGGLTGGTDLDFFVAWREL